MTIAIPDPKPVAFIRTAWRLLRMKARLLRGPPMWLRWNVYVGKRVSGFEAHRRLGLDIPVNVLSAAAQMGVEVSFHKNCAWDAALESDRRGRATIYVDIGASLEDQRYLIALALGYLLYTPPATVVRLRFDEHGRAHTGDRAGRYALVFALQLMLPLGDVRKRFGAHWLARHARVPVWFAQQGIDGPGWVLIPSGGTQVHTETIECVAIQFFGELRVLPRPYRHHHVIQQYHALTGHRGSGKQGFLTSEGRFVDRAEAAQIAFAAGQIGKLKQALFSEDLW